jgi:hypothetical protein
VKYAREIELAGNSAETGSPVTARTAEQEQKALENNDRSRAYWSVKAQVEYELRSARTVAGLIWAMVWPIAMVLVAPAMGIKSPWPLVLIAAWIAYGLASEGRVERYLKTPEFRRRVEEERVRLSGGHYVDADALPFEARIPPQTAKRDVTCSNPSCGALLTAPIPLGAIRQQVRCPQCSRVTLWTRTN